MEPTDELFPVVKMEPKRSFEVEISTPGRITALEAEVERLRGALREYADENNWSQYFLNPRYSIRTWLGDFEAWHIARAALEPKP